MDPKIYQILAQGASYWFAFLGLVIVWRSFAWLRKDGRLRRKRMRQLPDAGYVGEMVVIQGSRRLPEGSILPLGPEGVMGSLRICDVVLPDETVAGKHLTYRYMKGRGVYIEPWVNQEAQVDGEPVYHRGRPGVMHHGSRLQVGELLLRLRLFMGVETGGAAPRQEEAEPVTLSTDWREQTLTRHQAIRPWQEEAREGDCEGDDVYEPDEAYEGEAEWDAPEEAPPRRFFRRRRERH